ncbi:MAG: phosphatidate cytidylyltransferase [Spirochaetaceae bacterium]|jgi:phosphatidate cytidylyltransferase|nr:phosphatidate cytidylyltransferase [Spirochaetaceae bacterium]
MKKLTERLLIFFIGLPLLIAVVLFLPYKNHVVLNIMVVLVTALGSAEFAGMLKKKDFPINQLEAGILGALIPLGMTIAVSFEIGLPVVPASVILAVSWPLVSRVFSASAKLPDVLLFATAIFSVIIYPGFFMLWIIRMALLSRAASVILVFLLMVIADDSAAWAAGMLFGRKNRNIIPASPNKSIAGFIGGLTASVLIGLGAALLMPQVFAAQHIPAIPSGLILGFLSGIAADLGDLAESALKRSSHVKDSGTLIPGRGGVLDSIDSIAMAAPVYYWLYRVLF